MLSEPTEEKKTKPYLDEEDLKKNQFLDNVFLLIRQFTLGQWKDMAYTLETLQTLLKHIKK